MLVGHLDDVVKNLVVFLNLQGTIGNATTR